MKKGFKPGIKEHFTTFLNVCDGSIVANDRIVWFQHLQVGDCVR